MRMSTKVKNAELREFGAKARRRGKGLDANPYLDPSTEVVSQAMREHKAQQWKMGWKREDAIRRF